MGIEFLLPAEYRFIQAPYSVPSRVGKVNQKIEGFAYTLSTGACFLPRSSRQTVETQHDASERRGLTRMGIVRTW
jgi:hypothetical protein